MTHEQVTHKLRADSDQLTFTMDLSSPGTPAILESPAPELESRYSLVLLLMRNAEIKMVKLPVLQTSLFNQHSCA